MVPIVSVPGVDYDPISYPDSKLDCQYFDMDINFCLILQSYQKRIQLFNCHISELRWAELKTMSEEQKQNLEELVEELKNFSESYDSLSTWLAQKEKMVSVLGPMATEPAMVNTQLQQVEV